MGKIVSKLQDRFQLRLVKKEVMEDFARTIRSMGDTFAGTIEEFNSYHSLNRNSFYHIYDDKHSRNIGTLCLIRSDSQKCIIGGFTLDNSYVESAEVLSFIYSVIEDAKQASSYFTINVPFNISHHHFGNLIWKIQEYNINSNAINCIEEKDLPPPIFEAERVGSDNMKEILEFDLRFFRFGNTQEFMEICIQRSDVIYLVKCSETKATVGLGMLSKEVSGKRLLGPVYTPGLISGFVLMNAILAYAKNTQPATKIIAYVPEKSLGDVIFPTNGFSITPSQVWERRNLLTEKMRTLLDDDDVLRSDNIVALSSLVFSIY